MGQWGRLTGMIPSQPWLLDSGACSTLVGLRHVEHIGRLDIDDFGVVIPTHDWATIFMPFEPLRAMRPALSHA